MQWHRLPSQVVGALSLEVFKKVNMAQRDVVSRDGCDDYLLLQGD